jgi:hypothetical protein
MPNIHGNTYIQLPWSEQKWSLIIYMLQPASRIGHSTKWMADRRTGCFFAVLPIGFIPVSRTGQSYDWLTSRSNGQPVVGLAALR